MPEITKELREQLRAEWVEALESGEYQQGRGCLRYEEHYCCLGVACEVAVRHFPEISVKTHEAEEVTYDGHNADLPKSVQEALGLRTPNGACITFVLAAMNDHEGKSFAEIAAVIRSRPPGLFVD